MALTEVRRSFLPVIDRVGSSDIMLITATRSSDGSIVSWTTKIRVRPKEAVGKMVKVNEWYTTVTKTRSDKTYVSVPELAHFVEHCVKQRFSLPIDHSGFQGRFRY